MDINVGDFVLSLRLHTSLRYTNQQPDEAEAQLREERAETLVHSRAEREIEAARHVMEDLGWDKDRILKAQKQMEREARERKEEEEKGRAEKNAARRQARV